MNSKLNPYISFNGNAREAMEFYKTVFGGKLETTTFKEGGMEVKESEANKLMHSMLVADNDITLMGADTPVGDTEFKIGTNVSISLSGDNEKELSEYYSKLEKGGKVVQPLTKAPWGDTFGMVIDKFGIFWLVNIAGNQTK